MKNSLISARSAAKTFAVSTVAVCTTELVLDGGLAEGAVVRGNFGQVGQTNSFTVTIAGSFGSTSSSSSSGSNAAADINDLGGGPFSWSYSSATMVIAQTAPGPNNAALSLNVGDFVGAGLDFGDYGVMGGDFDGYVGMSFLSAGGTDFHYGWARVIQNDAAGTISILEYAYEDTPGTQIQIIPEASSLALLALGAGGLTMHRRRRKSA